MPIWSLVRVLQADFLAGSDSNEMLIGGNPVKIAPAPFLAAAREFHQLHQCSALSVGWTLSPGCTQYTQEMCTAMDECVAGFPGHVTFAVNGRLCTRSWTCLRSLLARPERSITLWGEVTAAERDWLAANLDPALTLVDLKVVG